MVSPVTRCTLRAEYNNDNFGFNLNHIITKTITPAEFDAEWAKHPVCQLNDQGRCGTFSLTVAAGVGNIPLIEHFVRKNPELMRTGTDSGRTPLRVAVECNQRSAVKMLIALGSDVNMAAQSGTTPLSVVAEKDGRFTSEEGRRKYGRETLHPYEIQKAQNIAMAKLLFFHGGVAEPAVNEEGVKVLQQAQKEIDEMRTSLFQEIYINTASITLSFETVKTIVSYIPLDEIPETVPELPDPIEDEDPYRSEFPDLLPADK
jgi:hypothetical protein